MELTTLIVLGGLGFLGARALSGSKSSGTATSAGGGGATGGAGCVATAKDCAALVACAAPILAKATAADITTLTQMSLKASALGCSGLVSDIAKKIADLGLGGGAGGGTTPTGAYSVVRGTGLVNAVGPGDMIIVGLTNPAGTQKYITPLVFSDMSDPKGVYEKTLAEIALVKFKKSGASIGDPTALLGAGSIVLGGPPDLPDGAKFPVNLASMLGLGDVLAIVTADQMKAGFTKKAGVGMATALVAGEDAPRTIGAPFGSPFGANAKFGYTR